MATASTASSRAQRSIGRTSLRPVSSAGERIKTDTPLEGSVLFLFYRTLKALGIRPGSEWSFEYDEEDGRMSDPDFVGKSVKVKVTEKDGRPRVRVMPVS